jgi:hypothetical protein
MLNDVAGKPIRAWDSRDHAMRTEYDELRRPLRSFFIRADALNPAREIRFEETVYGESASRGLTPAQILQANLRCKPYKHYDSAGVVTSEAHDFKGNLLRSTRQLVQDYKATPDWSQSLPPVLETEIFASSTRYDALNSTSSGLATTRPICSNGSMSGWGSPPSHPRYSRRRRPICMPSPTSTTTPRASVPT